MLTVLSFLVILPVGEHFHIVTALPALFFAVAARRIAFRSLISRKSWKPMTRAVLASACARRST